MEATKDWVDNVFDQVFILYANDGMTLLIKEMDIWTSDDGYSWGSNSLDEFVDRHKNDPQKASLAHLISNDHDGGVAYLGVICN